MKAIQMLDELVSGIQPDLNVFEKGEMICHFFTQKTVIPFFNNGERITIDKLVMGRHLPTEDDCGLLLISGFFSVYQIGKYTLAISVNNSKSLLEYHIIYPDNPNKPRDWREAISLFLPLKLKPVK